MFLEHLWKHVNVCTLLILPLFDEIVAGIKTKITPQVSFPFLLLAYECGLRNAYLCPDDYSILYVMFDETVIEEIKYASCPHFSMNELLISSSFFENIHREENKIIYALKIPDVFAKDIVLIRKSKYSAVSSLYKETIQIKHKYIPRWKNSLGLFICKENIPWGIVNKTANTTMDHGK